MNVVFFVPGPPVPCGRARVVKDSIGRSHGFNPASTTKYQAHVRAHAMAARAKTGVALGFGAVPYREGVFDVRIRVCRATRIGDTDNFAKSALDAMTGVFYKDDRQVRALSVRMFDSDGSLDECQPGMVIELRVLDEWHHLAMREKYSAGKEQSNSADARDRNERETDHGD